MEHHHSHHVDVDAADLAELGYRQRLNRSLGAFSSFAAGFSYISILTGMFQLFGFGYGFGGPLLFWAWLIVLAGQFCVALVFAELGARFPIAGSVYQWSKQVSNRSGSWLAGWMMLVGSIVTVAAVAMALQVVLPVVWSGFEIVDDPARNAVLLASITICLTTLTNVAGVRVMAKINNIGVIAELVGVVVVIALLAAHVVRGPGIVLTTQGAGPGLPGFHTLGYLAAVLMAALMPAYVMYGFDTASSLAEETKDPRRRTPPAILQALGAAGAAGAILLILALMAARTLDLETLGSGGLPMILESALGPVLGKVILVDVAFAIFVCTLAIHTATIRIAFSMARDNNLPLGARLSHVTEHSQAPAAPAVVSGLVAILVLVVNIGNAKIFTIVTSVAIVIVYVAYLLVTAPVLARRLRGWPADGGRTGLFTLGRRRGLVVNTVAVIYGLCMAVNLVWPRSSVFGNGVYAWGGVVFVGAVVVAGALYYLTVQRHRAVEVAAEHRIVPVGGTDGRQQLASSSRGE